MVSLKYIYFAIKKDDVVKERKVFELRHFCEKYDKKNIERMQVLTSCNVFKQVWARPILVL